MNGVSQKPVLKVNFDLVVPPILHVTLLGPVNDLLKSLKKVELRFCISCEPDASS